MTDIKLLGWKPALVGTCADASGNQMDGMKKGTPLAPTSQRACAAACDADAGCYPYPLPLPLPLYPCPCPYPYP